MGTRGVWERGHVCVCVSMHVCVYQSWTSSLCVLSLLSHLTGKLFKDEIQRIIPSIRLFNVVFILDLYFDILKIHVTKHDVKVGGGTFNQIKLRICSNN